MDFIWVALGFVALVVGGEFLVRSSVALSLKFNVSKMVIGMSVVSFATSAPELLVSLQAAISGAPAIAINNVIGSNIANIGLVLGLTALVAPIVVDRLFFKRHWPVMMLFSLGLYYALKNDMVLSAIEGVFLFLGLLVFLTVLIKSVKKDEVSQDVDDSLTSVSNFKIIVWLLIGAVALYLGSLWLVEGSKSIARSIGLSEAVIGVSLIAIGTSIPELAASIIAAAKQEKEISLGNLIGSNIFNIGSVLGLTAIVNPIPVTDHLILQNDILWMLGFAIILFPMVRLPKKMAITRVKGFVLLVAYSVFMFLIFTNGKF